VRFSLSASRLKAARNSLRILNDAVDFAITGANVYHVYTQKQVMWRKRFKINIYRKTCVNRIRRISLYSTNTHNYEKQHRNTGPGNRGRHEH
jgi:hypothetical protein